MPAVAASSGTWRFRVATALLLALLGLVVLAHSHGHSHGHAHGHDHGHDHGHAHGHDHGHDHGHAHAAPAESTHAHAHAHEAAHHEEHSHEHEHKHSHGHAEHVHDEHHSHGHGHAHAEAPDETKHATHHHSHEDEDELPGAGFSVWEDAAHYDGHDHRRARPQPRSPPLGDALSVGADAISAGSHGHGRAHNHHHGHHHGHHHHDHGTAAWDLHAYGAQRLWLRALGASLLVSCASLVCLALLPVLGLVRSGGAGAKPSQSLVNILSGFAVGAMLGDAFIHQLPHAFAAAPHSHSHSWVDAVKDQMVALSGLAGIMVFFLVEKVILSYGDDSGHGHSHSHGARKTEAGDGPQLKTAGWLNLFADAVHNFTDGMAIGASFVSGGPVAGWSKTLFILAHELPQEVGDYGILISSGFDTWQALGFNFLSALVALAGTVVALAVGTSSAEGSGYVEGFTAGGFIYISLAGVVPMMHSDKDASTLGQVLSMAGGVAVCVAIHASGGCSHSH